MLSDNFLLCFAINMFHLHSHSARSSVVLVTFSHLNMLYNIHGTRTNVESLHQQFTVISKDMDEESVTEGEEVDDDLLDPEFIEEVKNVTVSEEISRTLFVISFSETME